MAKEAEGEKARAESAAAAAERGDQYNRAAARKRAQEGEDDDDMEDEGGANEKKDIFESEEWAAKWEAAGMGELPTDKLRLMYQEVQEEVRAKKARKD